MTSKGICENCPFDAALNAGQELTDKFPHKNRNLSIGGIAVTRYCLESVADKLDCGGRIEKADAQFDCPLREIAYGARTLGVGSWDTKFMVDLEEIGKSLTNEGSSSTTGQYL